MKNTYTQPRWQFIALLVILGYETAGCLVGGTLLIIAPDGRLMDMPVQMMHGFFSNFLIPGTLLFGLGILNARAFFSVIRRRTNKGTVVGLALGALFIWFVSEIIILRELHWLHLMWGLPVLCGLALVIPMMVLQPSPLLNQKALLVCGIISTAWYIAINIFVPMLWPGYSCASQTVSELSAIDAPTRLVWVLLALPYPLLFAAFGWGILLLPGPNRYLQIAGNIILCYAIFNFYWPPMHLREVIAAGGGSPADTWHIAWAMVTLLMMILIMGFGAAALSRPFRIYSIITFAGFIVFGMLIATEFPGISQGLPTPMLGTWERMNIGLFMIWIVVFALALRGKMKTDEGHGF